MSETYKIKMLETTIGCDDGITPVRYEKGETFEVGKSLFNSFKNMGACELCKVEKQAEAPKVEEQPKPKKKTNPAKQNKVANPVKEDK